MVFTTAQKVSKHLDYFWNKICSQEIPKIAQSGYTDSHQGHAVALCLIGFMFRDEDFDLTRVNFSFLNPTPTLMAFTGVTNAQ